MTDKNTVCQIFGCLLHKPQLLSQVDKYSLSMADFSNKFEKYIYHAITSLYSQGATALEPIHIVNFLETNAAAATLFEQRGGIEYLQDCIEFSDVDNFDYYYNRLKKMNLLRDLKKDGFDITPFYIEDLSHPNAIEVNERFEELTAQDICNQLKRKLLSHESEYASPEEVKVESAVSGMRDLIKSMSETISFGLSLQGHIYNQVLGGAEKQALTIRSGCSGLGKTRQAVGDACYLAYPVRYNRATRQWEQHGNAEKVLFIITEQTFAQIRKMILAYLTDINESRFKLGHFTAEEEKLLDQALEVMDNFADNFTIIQMPNPTIELVKTLVRENCLTRQISYVFYDYVFIGPSLLNEFRGFNLRNDELLLMFATALKDLAVELNVAMFTSTQVNASADDNKNIRNEASLAGGRSTINKADNGAIMARPTPEELETLTEIIQHHGKTPNMVTDIFKCRSGEWTQVRIWSVVDLGRLKKEDLFITDARLEVIPDFRQEDINVQNWDDDDYASIMSYMNYLNGKE